MTDFSLFTDAQLKAAVDRSRAEFRESADKGMLTLASSYHRQMCEVLDELKARAASAHSVQGEAA